MESQRFIAFDSIMYSSMGEGEAMEFIQNMRTEQ